MSKDKSGGEGNEAPPQENPAGAKSPSGSTSFESFLNILKVTGEIPDKMEKKELEQLKDVHEVWVEQKAPRKFNLADLQKLVEIPLRIYRRKWKGDQYISFVAKGKAEQVGMQVDIEYGKNGAGETDYGVIIKRDRYPTIKYTKELAEKIIAKAKKYNDTVDLRFVMNQSNITVHNEENFFGDFDALYAKAMKKEVI